MQSYIKNSVCDDNIFLDLYLNKKSRNIYNYVIIVIMVRQRTKKNVFSKLKTAAICSLLTVPLFLYSPSKSHKNDLVTNPISPVIYQNNVAGINNFAIGDLERKLFSKEYGAGNFIKGKV